MGVVNFKLAYPFALLFFNCFNMNFSITILGSGAAVPLPERNPTAHLVNFGHRKFLLDCGEGTQMQIQRFITRPQKISHIFITHLHGDHFYGLIGLINTFHLLGRDTDLHIFGLEPLNEIINIQLEQSQTLLNYPMYFHPVDPSKSKVIFEDGQVSVRTIPMLHRVPTCGFLIREINDRKRSYAYCTDTAYSEKIVRHIRGCDLLYHEATFTHDRQADARAKFHSTAREAATIAHKAGVKKLLIGHYSARYKELDGLLQEAREVFPATELATDGMRISL